jgi:hypothetical protein
MTWAGGAMKQKADESGLTEKVTNTTSNI